MSHIRVLNLLNNRTIVSPNTKPEPKGDASELPFNQVYETLRSEAQRSTSRVESPGRSRLDRSDEKVEKTDCQVDGATGQSDKAHSARERQGDREAEIETGRSRDRRQQTSVDPSDRTDKEEKRPASAEVHRQAPRSTQTDRNPSAENGASAAQPANEPDGDQPASEAVQGASESGSETSQSADAQVPGLTGKPAEAFGEVAMTDAQRAVVLLAQLQRAGVGMVITDGSGNSSQTNGVSKASGTILPFSTDSGSSQSQKHQQASHAGTQQGPAIGGQGATNQSSQPLAARVQTTEHTDTQPENTAGTKTRAFGFDTADGETDAASDQQNRAAQNKVASKYGAQPEGKAPVDRPATNRTGQAVPQAAPQPHVVRVQDERAGESQTDGQAKPPLVRQAEEQAARIEGGRVIRMSTAPIKTENTANSVQGTDAKAAQRGQSLAAQASKAIARFVMEPSGSGQSDMAGVKPQPIQLDSSAPLVQSQAQSGIGQATSQGPASTILNTASSAASGLTFDAGGGASVQIAKADGAGLPQSLLNTPADSNVDRMVSVLKTHVGQHTSEIRLQLDPPDLGQVKIDVRMQQGTLYLDVETETSAGRDLINSRMHELRDALARHGIVVERANVQMRQAVYEPPQPHEQPQQQPQQQHPQHAQDQGRDSNQEAPGQMADQSYAGGQGGGNATGDDVPAPQTSTDLDGRTDDPRGGGVLDEPVTESLVDLVA